MKTKHEKTSLHNEKNEKQLNSPQNNSIRPKNNSIRPKNNSIRPKNLDDAKQKNEKAEMFIFCDICELSFDKQWKYDRHIKSKKHKCKEDELLECKICNMTFKTKWKYERHSDTKKHKASLLALQSKQTTFSNKSITTEQSTPHSHLRNVKETYVCSNCDKIYMSRSGLYKHSQKCKTTIVSSNNNNAIITNEAFMELVHTNKELQNIIYSQNEKLDELSKHPRKQIINNTNYIENYLNIECKDAVNLTDFINQLQITFNDLLRLGNDGFTNSIQHMFIDKIKDMEQTKRPIHCTNKRKRTLYIKDDNVWEKDKDQTQIAKVVNTLHKKNLNTLSNTLEDKTLFKTDEEQIQRNNMIINLTSANKSETVKTLTRDIVNSFNIKDSIPK
jgi:uncharacterized C2H2 Zn-finger protein